MKELNEVKPQIILISGKAQHGKDTTAMFLTEALMSMPFGSSKTVHYGDLLKYICSTFFDWNGAKDQAGRSLLQYVGTDVVRKKQPDYWATFLADMIGFFGKAWDYIIIPDTRFPNEISIWYDRGYEVTHVRVMRPGYDANLTSDQQGHVSETALDTVPPDLIVMNDGTLEDLKEKVWLVAKYFNPETNLLQK